MKPYAFLVLLLAGGGLLHAQDRKPSKDSTRISVVGCTKGRSLVATARKAVEPVVSPVLPGRRFRLAGPKKMLAEIRAQEGQLVEVTGLVRISQLTPAPPGMPLGKNGRVRLGGGPLNRDPTQVDPRRDPLMNEIVMDVESWLPLPEACPARDR